jgi:hypothetical protein
MAMDISTTKDIVTFSVETTEKGVKTFTIEMDELELIETGTIEKDGKITEIYKFKIIKKK